ncbi:Outer dense fiber protein 3-like [Oopsacas minuta]|uniref:Outer dense fiber protein 3-like n=1 Tax=Oopsacas minuta TaxID=111878 RepID=A0AAV7KBN7_9METZ|nr:Outer dense fiber protein 3-like [Oopsacas minuta]
MTTSVARPNIAAKERGPGPARYSLPGTTGKVGHDNTKKVSPSYSFGLKTGSIFVSSITPGPCHLVSPSYTRRGKEGNPKYSLAGRHKDLTPFLTPSPSRYGAERVAILREKSSPAYSMGSRSLYRRADTTPAPSAYTLPNLLGNKVTGKLSSAAYSMTGRPKVGGFDEDLARTPAPCTYTKPESGRYMRNNPSYSIQGRQFMPGDPTMKPGPGQHSPEKVKITAKSAPCYSMGTKHSDYVCPLIIDVGDE